MFSSITLRPVAVHSDLKHSSLQIRRTSNVFQKPPKKKEYNQTIFFSKQPRISQ